MGSVIRPLKRRSTMKPIVRTHIFLRQSDLPSLILILAQHRRYFLHRFRQRHQIRDAHSKGICELFLLSIAEAMSSLKWRTCHHNTR